MNFVKGFEDLDTYILSREISFEIYLISKSFPAEERYSLTDQVRRSSRSVGAQVAECWAKRRYEKHFISKLTDTDAENNETLHWLSIALECEYIPAEWHNNLRDKCTKLGLKINSMIQKSVHFCRL